MHYPHPIEIATRRKRIALVAGGILIIAGLVVFTLWPAGPYYHGRSLDAWLKDFVNPLGNGNSIRDLQAGDIRQRMEDSQRAVKAIGTNAIPRLLQLLQAKGADARNVPSSLGLRASRSRWFPSAAEKHSMAQAGFMILQKDASPAVPELTALTKDSDPGTRMRAFEILFFVVPPDYKTLTVTLVPFGHDPDSYNRERAAGYMRSFLGIISPEDAEKASVYQAFPELRSPTATAEH
jgi:hypothetical protein